jgi:hypothetical protein
MAILEVLDPFLSTLNSPILDDQLEVLPLTLVDPNDQVSLLVSRLAEPLLAQQQPTRLLLNLRALQCHVTSRLVVRPVPAVAINCLVKLMMHTRRDTLMTKYGMQRVMDQEMSTMDEGDQVATSQGIHIPVAFIPKDLLWKGQAPLLIRPCLLPTRQMAVLMILHPALPTLFDHLSKLVHHPTHQVANNCSL